MKEISLKNGNAEKLERHYGHAIDPGRQSFHFPCLSYLFYAVEKRRDWEDIGLAREVLFLPKHIQIIDGWPGAPSPPPPA
jgi:hypothetical protein